MTATSLAALGRSASPGAMRAISYDGYRLPREIIQRAVWMYQRFTLSVRDVEEMLVERGIIVTYEIIRRWGLAFGPAMARGLRAQRPKPHCRWHRDEVFLRIEGRRSTASGSRPGTRT